jgi:hypothetical protein
MLNYEDEHLPKNEEQADRDLRNYLRRLTRQRKMPLQEHRIWIILLI